MRKTAIALVIVTTLGGCVSFEKGSGPGPGPGTPHYGVSRGPAPIPGAIGPMGTPVPMIEPYASSRPGTLAAQAMMSRSMPMPLVQSTSGSVPYNPAALQMASAHGIPQSGIVQASGVNTGGSVIPAHVPPSPTSVVPPPPGAVPPPVVTPPGGILHPPGVPGVPGMPPGGPMLAQSKPPIPYNAVAAIGVMADRNQIRFPVSRTQVRFIRPSGMKVSWFTVGADGKGSYADTAIEVPGRYNFAQAAIYRLKLSNIEGRPGLEVYPTLEVVPANPKTEAFLAHSAVPVEFTPEDFKQIAAGNYVVKVIYLPDPQNQDLAAIGPDEIISTQLEPGADPIEEARRRGSILLIIRMGNMDQEAPNTPPINAPVPGSAAAPQINMGPNLGMVPPLPMPGPLGAMPGPMGAMGPGTPGPGPMIPYGALQQPAPGLMMPGQPNLAMPGQPNLAAGTMPVPVPGMTPGVPLPQGAMRPDQGMVPQMNPSAASSPNMGMMPTVPGAVPPAPGLFRPMPSTGLVPPAPGLANPTSPGGTNPAPNVSSAPMVTPGMPLMAPPQIKETTVPPAPGMVPATNRPISSAAPTPNPGGLQLTSYSTPMPVEPPLSSMPPPTPPSTPSRPGLLGNLFGSSTDCRL